MPTSSIARPSKNNPNLAFGLKIYHLATLVEMHLWKMGKLKILFGNFLKAQTRILARFVARHALLFC
jgi:hypothetical protein